jgi:hypothetical protein
MNMEEIKLIWEILVDSKPLVYLRGSSFFLAREFGGEEIERGSLMQWRSHHHV